MPMFPALWVVTFNLNSFFKIKFNLSQKCVRASDVMRKVLWKSLPKFNVQNVLHLLYYSLTCLQDNQFPSVESSIPFCVRRADFKIQVNFLIVERGESRRRRRLAQSLVMKLEDWALGIWDCSWDWMHACTFITIMRCVLKMSLATNLLTTWVIDT